MKDYANIEDKVGIEYKHSWLEDFIYMAIIVGMFGLAWGFV